MHRINCVIKPASNLQLNSEKIRVEFGIKWKLDAWVKINSQEYQMTLRFTSENRHLLLRHIGRYYPSRTISVLTKICRFEFREHSWFCICTWIRFYNEILALEYNFVKLQIDFTVWNWLSIKTILITFENIRWICLKNVRFRLLQTSLITIFSKVLHPFSFKITHLKKLNRGRYLQDLIRKEISSNRN